jgi:hypothetical protein
MKKVAAILLVVFLFALIWAPAPAAAYSQECWGQATAAFARMGEMGQHASEQPTPRDGLANLAGYLYDDGTIDAPTLQSLAAYLVSIDPDLSVDACM